MNSAIENKIIECVIGEFKGSDKERIDYTISYSGDKVFVTDFHVLVLFKESTETTGDGYVIGKLDFERVSSKIKKIDPFTFPAKSVLDVIDNAPKQEVFEDVIGDCANCKGTGIVKCSECDR